MFTVSKYLVIYFEIVDIFIKYNDYTKFYHYNLHMFRDLYL